MRLPPRPEIEWKQDGTPVDRRVGDVYYAVGGGLAESRAVFLAGSHLPERWATQPVFTVAELGFGTGLNFLAVWDLWRSHGPPGGWLNFVSFEGSPLDREDATRALAAWPELGTLAGALLDRWPVRARGVRQVVWAEARLTLTLHVGDIGETLAQSVVKADAWFLDGFSPARNAEMWDAALWPLVAERSAPGATAATFTVAGAVRRGLEHVGYTVERRPGHGAKRQRLEARFEVGRREGQGEGGGGNEGNEGETGGPDLRRVAIIGAGIAGASIAHALTRRGAHVTVFDTAPGPDRNTSSNPLALVMPRLDSGDTVEARLLVDAYLAARQTYAGAAGAQPVDVVHRPKDAGEAARFARLLEDPPLGLDLLEALADGVLHKGAVMVRPAQVLAAMLDGAQVRWGAPAQVDADARTVDGEAFDAIVLATGWAMAQRHGWLKLQARAGQVDWIDVEVDAPPSAVASGHYALASGTLRLWGATFERHEGGDAAISAAARAQNATALDALSPYWVGQARGPRVQSRAGIRATTPDRLPVIGPVPDVERVREAFAGLRTGRREEATVDRQPGLYLAGGFGARGFTFGPWAGAILAAQIFADPVPARREALDAIDPVRQVLRDLKRGKA